jgi:hypothetical protein
VTIAGARRPARVPRPVAMARGALAAARGPNSAGATDGVGSNVVHPMPGNQASTHEWASKSRTTQSRRVSSRLPGVNPVATRAGTPAIRSSSAIAPEKYWQ